MLEKIKYWLITEKECHSCCLNCPYYNECKTEVTGEKSLKETVPERV